jgi:hypothetical protein
MTWIYLGETIEEINPKYLGFVYIITELSSGKKYIGKKKCWFKKTSQKTVKLKNGNKKVKKIRSLVPSDWKEYYGSSETLLEAIELNGKENYHREIIKLCETESELSYEEARLQFVTDCLRKPDGYFNSWVMVRVRRSNLIKL